MPKPQPPDPANLSLLQRLDLYYRKNFPRLVAKLEEDQSYREFLLQLKERWLEVYDQQLRSGNLESYQAQELADDVVFPKPGPPQVQQYQPAE